MPTTNEDLADITVDDVEGAFRANVFAQIWLTKAAVPHMRPGASIINTASVQAKVASKGMIVYAATKGVITGRKSGAEMARLYNVSQPTVSRIVAQHRTPTPELRQTDGA